MYNIVMCKESGKRCTLCKLDYTECPNRIKQTVVDTKEKTIRQEDPTEGKYSGLITED